MNLLQYCFCFTFWLLGRESCEIPAPQPGIEPTSPSALEGEIATTGPPGKSLYYFLDSTYKWYKVFFFVWLISLSIIFSRFIHTAADGSISFFFYGGVIFHCMYKPHLLNPIICWALGLFPCLGYCKQCCYEHRGSCIFLN